MHRSGHLGAGLLVYAPLFYWLWITDRPLLALVGLVVVLWTVPLPDIDLQVPGLSHRGSTHTIAFAILIALAWTVIGWSVGGYLTETIVSGLESVVLPIEGWHRVLGQLQSVDARTLSAVAGLSGGVAVLSHLLADLLTPMGLAPFWPVSSIRYSLGVCRASSRSVNALLLGLGVITIALISLEG